MTDLSRTATYFLAVQPTTFDVCGWICAVKTMGFESISLSGDTFQKKPGYTEEISKRRLENIVKPLIALSGTPLVEGIGDYHKITGVFLTHMGMLPVALWEDRGELWRFPYERKHEHITVTIRQSWRHKHRDSNRQEWDKFIAWAENNGERVIVLEDREENPITIAERHDLYQCKMNLGVSNGPMWGMCGYSTAPYIICGLPGDAEDIRLTTLGHKIPLNGQMPWHTPSQRLVWAPDTFDVIVQAFEEVMACT